MTISLSGNPIIKHEARSQWRRGRAYWLLLIYAVLLAGLTVHSYRQPVEDIVHNGVLGKLATYPSNGDVTESMAQNGRETFRALATLQAALWLLIAPALTATSIAGEREAGLLEALQLSRLRAAQIVGGKFIACLWLVLLMILAALPPLSICFLMGGVAPEDFLRASVVQLSAAISGASIGLFFSARSPRPSWAMSQTFGVIALWSIAAYTSFSTLARWMVINPFWDTVHEFIAVTHPVSVLQTVLGVSQPRFATPFATPTFSANDAFAIFLVLQTLLCVLLLRAATRATAKPLPAAMWIDRDRWTDRLRARWQAERERREEQRQRAAAARLNNEMDESVADDARFVDDAKMALLAEFPIEKFVRFQNPVLRREVRHKFRWRKASLWVAIGRAIMLLMASCLYVFGLFLALDSSFFSRNNTPQAAWLALAQVLLMVQTPALAFMAATSFSREREAGTWESLNLSALRPTEVLWGKLAAPMVTLLYYSVPFWPIMLAPWLRGLSSLTGMGIVLTSMLVLAASAFATTAMALLISWLCRKTVTAVSWTISAVFAFHFGLPSLMPWLVGLWHGMFGVSPAPTYLGSQYNAYYNTYAQSQSVLAALHPWQALQNLTIDMSYRSYAYPNPYRTTFYEGFTPVSIGLSNALLQFAFSAVMLGLLLLAMRRSIRERDHFRGNAPKSTAARRATAQVVTVAD